MIWATFWDLNILNGLVHNSFFELYTGLIFIIYYIHGVKHISIFISCFLIYPKTYFSFLCTNNLTNIQGISLYTLKIKGWTLRRKQLWFPSKFSKYFDNTSYFIIETQHNFPSTMGKGISLSHELEKHATLRDDLWTWS